MCNEGRLQSAEKSQGCFILNQWQGIDLQVNKHQEGIAWVLFFEEGVNANGFRAKV